MVAGGFMPEPIIVEQRRTLANGTTTVYRMWRASWTDEAKVRHTVSLGNADVVTKRVAVVKMQAKMKAEQKPTAATITVGEWVADCLTAMSTDKAPKTVDDYARTVAMLKEAWGPKALRSITKQQAEAWMNGIVGGAYTRRRYLLIAAAMFARATSLPTIEKPYLRVNPFATIKKPDPGETADVRYITVAERRRLIESLPDTNWRALVALTGLCGLRIEEALAVTPADVNHDRAEIVVRLRRERKGQGGGTKQGTRLVPMSPAAYALVLERLGAMPEGAVTIIDARATRRRHEGKPQHSTDHMRRYQEQVGILGVDDPFHDLRKAWADDMSMLHGCELSAQWCGHDVEVALKHYRQRNTQAGALVTKKGNPREELEKAYSELDSAMVCGANTVQMHKSR